MDLADTLRFDHVAVPGRHDELHSPSGGVRAHWEPLVRALSGMGSVELGRRWEAARRLIHENGVKGVVLGGGGHTVEVAVRVELLD